MGGRQTPRVSVTGARGETQEVVITVHSAGDVETPEFEAFLSRVVAAYEAMTRGGELVAAGEMR